LSELEGLLFVLSAPSGAGKTSLVRALLEADPQLAVSISHTTRAQRRTERDGVNYHFVDDAAFQALADAGGFLEHAEVFGHRYGTSHAAVSAEMARGCDVILEIDYQGAQQVRRAAAVVSVFILPPSQRELAARLERRGEDDPEVIRERLDKARLEISHYGEYDYLVINDRFETALADLQAIVRAERLRLAHQQGRLEGLLSDLLSVP